MPKTKLAQNLSSVRQGGNVTANKGSEPVSQTATEEQEALGQTDPGLMITPWLDLQEILSLLD